jgi:hypothetical protein
LLILGDAVLDAGRVGRPGLEDEVVNGSYGYGRISAKYFKKIEMCTILLGSRY